MKYPICLTIITLAGMHYGELFIPFILWAAYGIHRFYTKHFA